MYLIRFKADLGRAFLFQRFEGRQVQPDLFVSESNTISSADA